MKNNDHPFAQLFEEATALYTSQKAIMGLLSALDPRSFDPSVVGPMIRETNYNKTLCAQLEGFLTVAGRVSHDERRQAELLSFLSVLWKRIKRKYEEQCYETAIFVADTSGQYDVARQLRELSAAGVASGASVHA